MSGHDVCDGCPNEGLGCVRCLRVPRIAPSPAAPRPEVPAADPKEWDRDAFVAELVKAGVSPNASPVEAVAWLAAQRDNARADFEDAAELCQKAEAAALAALASPPSLDAVTEEMVEAGAKAHFEEWQRLRDIKRRKPWEDTTQNYRNGFRDTARRILTAALRGAQ